MADLLIENGADVKVAGNNGIKLKKFLLFESLYSCFLSNLVFEQVIRY